MIEMRFEILAHMMRIVQSLLKLILRLILQVQTAVASGYSEELRTRTEELEKLVKALHREAKAGTRGQERLAYVERGAER